MGHTPPELQHAARTVARRVEKLVLEMLLRQELGEVTIVVGWGSLQPIKTVATKDTAVKVGRGRLDTLTEAE